MVDLRQAGERQRDVGARPHWITTCAVDLAGLDNQDFWKDYWDNGLNGTALYFLPHLTAMQRSWHRHRSRVPVRRRRP